MLFILFGEDYHFSNIEKQLGFACFDWQHAKERTEDSAEFRTEMLQHLIDIFDAEGLEMVRNAHFSKPILSQKLLRIIFGKMVDMFTGEREAKNGPMSWQEEIRNSESG